MTGGGNRARSGRLIVGTTPPSGAVLGGGRSSGGGADGVEAKALEGSEREIRQVCSSCMRCADRVWTPGGPCRLISKELCFRLQRL